MNGKINIKTISVAAGVSTSIVSRILSGKARQFRIAEDTEKRVLEIAAKMNFRPNYYAHSLNTGKTYNIGLVFANSVGRFFGSIMEGVEKRLRDTEYQMVVATCDNAPDIEKLETDRMLYRQVEGIITYPLPQKYTENPFGTETPVVVIGRDIGIDADYVLFDDYVAGECSARDFIAAGCRKFSALTYNDSCVCNHNRIAGFIDTLRKSGMAERDIRLSRPNADGSLPPADIREIIQSDAIFAVNTSLLLKYLTGIAALRDPASMHLRSFGDDSALSFIPYKIEAWIMPAEEMGWTAADILLSRLGSGHRGSDRKYLPWGRLYSNQ